jgi:hypothetical protein
MYKIYARNFHLSNPSTIRGGPLDFFWGGGGGRITLGRKLVVFFCQAAQVVFSSEIHVAVHGFYSRFDHCNIFFSYLNCSRQVCNDQDNIKLYTTAVRE